MRTKTILSVQPVADRGGSSQALLRMCRHLKAGGWECHVVIPAPGPLASELRAGGATVHVVPMRRLTGSGGLGYWLAYAALWPVSVLRILWLARRVRPGVVHSNSLHCWYGWAVAWLSGRPHLWHGREVVVQSKWALGVERRLTRRFAWRLVAVSETVAAQFRSPNVVVVHDGLRPEDGFSPQRAGGLRPRAGIADDAVLVGAAGRLDTWKGFDVLLGAFPDVRRLRPDAELAIAGAVVGGKEAYAENLLAIARRSEGVHWLGAREDMAEFMADLDLFVMPSTEPEPFGLVAVEALASGVPVVVTDHGGAPEMLRDAPAAAGKLCPPGDRATLARAIVAMLPPGPSSREKRRGREAVLVGDPRRLLSLFEEALEKGGRRR
ncbi:MAG: glycosyltransferase [Acidimicrobiales bacterium]